MITTISSDDATVMRPIFDLSTSTDVEMSCARLSSLVPLSPLAHVDVIPAPSLDRELDRVPQRSAITRVDDLAAVHPRPTIRGTSIAWHKKSWDLSRIKYALDS